MQDYQKELLISSVKTAMSLIPVYGGIFNEIIFEYPGRLNQNRLNIFTELLSQYISEKENIIDFENINKEDFSDVLESILLRVTKTKSEEKLKRFRDILFHCIENNIWDIENTERFLDLISNVKEYEILILKHHSVFDEKYELRNEKNEKSIEEKFNLEEELRKEEETKDKGFANNYDTIKTKLRAKIDSIKVVELQNKQLDKYRIPSFYNLNDEEFLYSKQKMYSLGLLIDSGIGAIGAKPFERMSITNFGKRFIEFITNSK